jgi:HK97 gp10 family phage protein
MSFEVEIIGIDRIKAVLGRIEGGMDKNMAEALETIGNTVRDDAQSICPIGTPASTGNPNYIESHALQRSIRREEVARAAGNIWEVGVRAGGYIVNPNSGRMVDYAIPIEYGWSKQAPQGFLRPALLRNKQAFMDVMKQAVKNIIEEATAW